MDTSASTESAFEQAKKYGEDLAKLYAIEKAKRVNLQISNQKLQAIFSTTPDGLAVLNDRLAIQEANPAFWSLVERPVPNGDVPLADVLPFANLLDPLKQPAAEQNIIQVEVDLPLTKTMWRNLLVNAVPLSAGNYHGWLLSAHDLTERKRLENLKSEFINIAAHELRTPLAAVLGFSQVLKETLETDDGLAGHLLNTILQSGNRLKDIIDELIEFADIRYQTETSSGGALTFNLVDTVKTVLENVRRAAEGKEIQIFTEFPPATVTFTGNRNILQEAIRHIVENAITFNDPGGTVTVRITDTPDTITVEVEDSGIGIAQKEQTKIFDKFYQVEEHLTRSVGGLGLGLAIAQRGVQLHNGDITVRSTLGEGSCFTITLPKTQTAGTGDTEIGLRDDFHQTLALGKDFARVVASERKLAQILQQYQSMAQSLRTALENNASRDELLAILNRTAPDTANNAE